MTPSDLRRKGNPILDGLDEALEYARGNTEGARTTPVQVPARTGIGPHDLRRIRRDLGLSQNEFAKALGYEGRAPGRGIRHYESGTREMPPLLVRLLAMIDRHGMDWG